MNFWIYIFNSYHCKLYKILHIKWKIFLKTSYWLPRYEQTNFGFFTHFCKNDVFFFFFGNCNICWYYVLFLCASLSNLNDILGFHKGEYIHAPNINYLRNECILKFKILTFFEKSVSKRGKKVVPFLWKI